jgi:hypothetical protein
VTGPAKLAKIDRRIIFLFIMAAVIIPFFRPLGVPVHVTDHVQKVFDFIENVPPGEQPVLVSMDYSPGTMPELYPMNLAILRHCFARGVRVVGMTLDPRGAGIGELAMTRVADEYEVEYGEDYVYLGFRPGIIAVILGIGEDIKRVFGTDNYGTDLDSIPMMREVSTYDDIPLVVTLAASSMPESWISYANSRYGQLIASGVTAVMAADFYPWLQTGQFIGMLGGLKGASEYELLVEEAGYSSERKDATRGMDSQSVVHLLIVILIVMGNISYLASRKSEDARRENV